MASEPAMSDHLVLRLVSSERLVPDALLNAEARISDLQFRNARLVQSLMHMESVILDLKRNYNRLADSTGRWDDIDEDPTPEGGWSP